MILIKKLIWKFVNIVKLYKILNLLVLKIRRTLSNFITEKKIEATFENYQLYIFIRK